MSTTSKKLLPINAGRPPLYQLRVIRPGAGASDPLGVVSIIVRRILARREGLAGRHTECTGTFRYPVMDRNCSRPKAMRAIIAMIAPIRSRSGSCHFVAGRSSVEGCNCGFSSLAGSAFKRKVLPCPFWGAKSRRCRPSKSTATQPATRWQLSSHLKLGGACQDRVEKVLSLGSHKGFTIGER